MEYLSLSFFFFLIYFPFSSSIRLVTQQLLTSDWAVYIPEEDQRDGCDKGVYLSESQVNEIEMELLKEKLQELCLQVKEQEVLPEEVKKKKKKYCILYVSKQSKERPQGGRGAHFNLSPVMFLISQIISRHEYSFGIKYCYP